MEEWGSLWKLLVQLLHKPMGECRGLMGPQLGRMFLWVLQLLLKAGQRQGLATRPHNRPPLASH